MKPRIAGCLVALFVAATEPVASAADESLLVIAEATASPVSEKNDGAIAWKEYEDAAVMLRNEIAYQRVAALTASPAVQGVRQTCLEHLGTLHRSMEQLRAYDQRTPDFGGLAANAIAAGPAIYRAANEQPLTPDDDAALAELGAHVGAEVIDGLINAYNAWTERANYKNAYVAMRRAAANAVEARCAADYAATELVDAAFAVQVDGSWNDTFRQDWVQFHNASGRTLTNVIIVSRLRGFDPATSVEIGETHVHYVPQWSPDQWLLACYPARSAEGIAGGQSLDTIHKVVASIYSDQIRGEVAHQYVGEAYDSDVKRYVEEYVKPQFNGRWCHYADGNNLLFNTGHSFGFQGTCSMPVGGMSVTAVQGDRTLTLWFTQNSGRLTPGESAYPSSQQFNQFDDPSSVTVELWFPNSNYKYPLTWNYAQ